MAQQSEAELKRIKDLQSSINVTMDDIISKQDKRNKKLGEEVSFIKKITEDLSDTESTAKALALVEAKRLQISKQNFGVNNKNKKEVLTQISATKKLLGIRLQEGQIIQQTQDQIKAVTDSLTSGFESAASSLEKIPLIGGLMAKPFKAASESIKVMGSVASEVFSEVFAKEMMKKGMTFAKAHENAMGVVRTLM